MTRADSPCASFSRLGHFPSRPHDRIEQKLKRPVRLAAEEDLRAAQHQLPFADRGRGDRHAAFEMLLAPGPAAAERRLVVEPGDALEALGFVFVLGDPEDRV